MRIIAQKSWSYTLTEEDRGLVFSVLCGQAALFEVRILLNEDEIRYFNEDPKFLDVLAKDIENNLSFFEPRRVGQ